MVIDEMLDNVVHLTREEFQAVEEQRNRLCRMEETVAPLGLSLEMLLDKLMPSLKLLPPMISPAEVMRKGMDHLPQVAPAVTATMPCQSPGSLTTPDISDHEHEGVIVPPNPALSKEVDARELETPVAQDSEPARATPAQIEQGTQPLVGCDPKSPAPESGQKRRRRRIKTQWPSKSEFLQMLWLKRATQIAKDLDCGAPAVLAKADELGLRRHEAL